MGPKARHTSWRANIQQRLIWAIRSANVSMSRRLFEDERNKKTRDLSLLPDEVGVLLEMGSYSPRYLISTWQHQEAMQRL